MKGKDVFIIADNIVSPLGFTTGENFEALSQMRTGLELIRDSGLSAEAFYGGRINDEQLNKAFSKTGYAPTHSRFERMVLVSASRALKEQPGLDIKNNRTLFVLSTTKGNITSLKNQQVGDEKFLWSSAKGIATELGIPTTPVVVSNACISGILALIVAKRMIDGGLYDTAVVCGADELSEFVVSGFQSFKAVSDTIARPYDADRNGISLGEGAATMIISSLPSGKQSGSNRIKISGGASSNDANHISGPSRTGDGLLLAIKNTLKQAGVSASEIDHISGHGTATLYNDEMEALAVDDAGLGKVPMNSLKSYFGHTLGAAGLIESVIGIESIRKHRLIGTLNYSKPGVSRNINIQQQTEDKQIRNCLKTAAGFGGCNAAILFEEVHG